MRKAMHTLTVLFVLCTVSAYLIYHLTENTGVYSAFVTFLTFSYHFIMRLIVGSLIYFVPTRLLKYDNAWFKVKRFERKIYSFLRVKKWKGFMPTYNPDSFSLKDNSPEKIAVTMCSAELCHEIIIAFSFVPISFSLKFGVLPVFVATSILAAMIDLMFVIIQRFNRPRIIRLIQSKTGIR